MTVSAGGLAPPRGRFFRLAVAGARSDRVLVLSEDAWNAYTNDCVIVPFFRDPEARESVLRPRLDGELIANCTAVTSVAQEDLGDDLGDCPAAVVRAVAAGVRSYFDIDGLLDPPRLHRRVAGPGHWWPRQAEVQQALRIAPTPKWVAIVSEDASNAALTHAAAVRLTSQDTTKPWRQRWEVPLRQGYAIAGDLHLIPHGSFELGPALSPPFARLSGDELRALARRLVETLEL